MMILNNPSEGESTWIEVLPLNRSLDFRMGFEDRILSNVVDEGLGFVTVLPNPCFNDSVNELVEN